MKFLTGTLCGGVMEIEFPYFTPPYMIIEAENKKDAVKLYNNKAQPDYFDGEVMAVVSDDKLKNISEYISPEEVGIIYNEVKAIEEKGYTMQEFKKFNNAVSSIAKKHNAKLFYIERKNYLLSFLSKHNRISIFAATRTIKIGESYYFNVSDEKLEDIFKNPDNYILKENKNE